LRDSIEVSGFKRISCDRAREIIKSIPNLTIVDIRDRESFELNHIPGSIHLDNQNIEMFLNNTKKDLPMLIYCYHGNSSQGAAKYFVENGFKDVYSMDGGFAKYLSNI
jgi:thiosulfate sulfurtransferase